MEFSPEQIEKIEEYAALFFTHKEIGFMVGINKNEMNEFISIASNEETVVGCQIYASRLKSIAEIRQRQVDSAISGSANAQIAVEKLINNLNFEE